MGSAEEFANLTCTVLEVSEPPGEFVTLYSASRVIFSGNNTVGSVVTARCRTAGLVLPGADTFFCTNEGTWYPEPPGNCTVPDPSTGSQDDNWLTGDRLILIASWGGFGAAVIIVLLLLALVMCIHKSTKKPKETVQIRAGFPPESMMNGMAPGRSINAYDNEVAYQSTEISRTPSAYANQLPPIYIPERATSENNYNYVRDHENSRRGGLERSNSYEMKNLRHQIPRPASVYCPEDYPSRFHHGRPNVYEKEPFAEFDGSRQPRF